MNGFLVIGRTNLDDVPMFLGQTREEAESYASTADEELVVAAARCFLRVDASQVINLAIVEFHGGYPTPVDIVKTF